MGLRRARRAAVLGFAAVLATVSLMLGTAVSGATPLPADDQASASITSASYSWGPFSDVKTDHKFSREINWMFDAGLSTGVKNGNGRQYLPSDRLTREAMAAFMFRKYADPGYQAPRRSWFNDVQAGHKFYREISWMYEYGLSTGVNNEYDGRIYQPKSKLSREAMAAFMYRALHDGGYVEPAWHLIDVSLSDPFSEEISWMFEEGLSTGVNTPAGVAYQPKGRLSREAMAAFMYRSKDKPADITRIANPTPPQPPKPRPKPPVETKYFKNCTEAWNAGVAPLRRGDPGYGPHLDRDGDGIACERRPR